MAIIGHSTLDYAEQHKLHFKEYANKAAREGASGLVAGDDHKVALQTDDHSLWILTAYVGPTWVAISSIPSGTKMVFYQDTAPTGWTIQNTLDDKLLFVSKGSGAGGETGGGAHSTGTWTVAGLTKDAHTHAFTQPSNHTALALSNHTTLTLSNHSNHVFTQPSAHVITQPTFDMPGHRHQWYNYTNASANDQSYNTAGNAIDLTKAISGSYAKIMATDAEDWKLNQDFFTNVIGPTACTRTQSVALSAHGSGAVDAHSAHSFSQNIDAHSFSQNIDAHSGGAVGAQDDAVISSDATWRPAAYVVIIASKD